MKTITITILVILFAITSALSQDLSGIWHGVATASNKTKITIVFKIKKLNETYKTTMAVPTFNVQGILPKETTLVDGVLFVDGSNLGMNYKGTWDKETKSFNGTYSEGGVQFQLKLIKGNPPKPELNRPQEPKEPLAYFSEEVTFFNKKDNITLSGTFTRPHKNGNYPVVVLISGSGRQDRNSSMMTHRPFLVLSDYLTKNNIAVLRFDDRGFGKSEGNFDTATTADFATDVLSAVHYLKKRTDVNTKQIGLIGHSEGGIIAPLVANQTKDVAFIISMAGTGISGKKVSMLQAKMFRPFPVKDEAAFQENLSKVIDIVTADKDLEVIKKEVYAHNTNYLTPILKGLGASDENIKKFIAQQSSELVRPWNRFFYSYNPSKEFEKITIPVLSLNGDKDIQVDAKINQPEIKKALIKSGNTNYKIVTLKNLNHLFQECKSCTIKEYQELTQTMSPIVLQEISSWINEIIEEID